jgi:hypothetical protein
LKETGVPAPLCHADVLVLFDAAIAEAEVAQ